MDSSYGFTIKTPLGWAAVICNAKGEAVRSFLPSSKQRAEEFVAHLPRGGNNRIEKLFVGYFSGEKRDSAKISVCLDGRSPFQKKVLQALRNIPCGTTTTYKQLAALAGNPSATRAVGSAMARNPLPLIIPCHRVVRSDGTLGFFRRWRHGVKTENAGDGRSS